MPAVGTLGRRGAPNAGQGCPAVGTHRGNGSPRVVRPCRRGKVHRVTVPIRRQQQLLVRCRPGRAAGGETALWNLLVQRIGALRIVLARAPTARSGTVICNMRRKICSLRWHSAHDPPAMWSWWKRWRKSLSRSTYARLQVAQQICMQEAGQIERAASRARARGWKDWASTTAMADGARFAHRWTSRWPPWVEASVDANRLAVQPQEQADLLAEEWVSTVLQSYHLHLLTICAKSVVRSARTLLLVPTTCTQLCT